MQTKAEATHLYFGYGANCNPFYFTERFPKAVFRTAGYMNDWALTFAKPSLDGSAKASIQPAASLIWGAIWELQESDFRALDRIESGYSRGMVEVIRQDDHNTVRAVAYFPRSLNPHILPSIDYTTKIGAGLRSIGVPKEYYEQILQLPMLTLTVPKKIDDCPF